MYTEYISAAGRKERSETGYCIISLHTNMHVSALWPDVLVCRARSEREMVRRIRTEGEVMLNHFSNTVIRELGHVEGAGGSNNRKDYETVRK